MHQGRKTLTRYTIEEEHKHPGASGEFSGLLNSLATAIKIISNQVNKGALIGALGNAGTDAASVNVQGEVQVERFAVQYHPGASDLAWASAIRWSRIRQ